MPPDPDAGRFQKFYADNRRRLIAYMVRMTADGDEAVDIVQETFTKYLEKYGKKRLSVPLLYAIARNTFLDEKRRRGRRNALPGAEADEALTPEGQLLVRESYHRVIAALGQLKPETREVLSLVVSSGLPYRTVAGILGLSESCVKVTVYRARLQLKAILQEETA